MRQEVVRSLFCPSCGAGLDISHIPDLEAAREDKEILFGVAACKCREYPIVSGILIYKGMKQSGTAVEMIKRARTRGDLERTIMLFMGEKFVNLALKFESFFNKLFRRRSIMSFWKLATFIENSPFATYAKYRFSCPSLISAMPFFPVIKSALTGGGKILDLGSGMGHLSYLISGHFGSRDLFCADISFRGLFFTKRYMAGEGASCILLDAKEKLPFHDGFFKVVISMDALQYIEEKELCAKELDRAMLRDGLMVFVHIHNQLVPGIAAGRPLSPEGYRGLFPSDNEFRFFTEISLMRTMFSGSGVDLKAASRMDEVKASDAIAFIVSRNAGIFRKYESYFALSTDLRRYILNPLYRKRKGKYVRVFPAARYEEEYYLIGDFFPETVDPCLPDEELKRKLVLIPVPENYMKKNEQLNYVRLWR
jgi:SAM-dependent methyltransferase